jgi:hypothetical protein
MGPTSPPDVVIASFIHYQVRALRTHPDPRKRVTRPTTPATWLRRLASALPEQSRALHAPAALTTRLLAGYAAMAPAPSTLVQRDVQQQWQAALDETWDRFRRDPSPLTAAVWVSLELMRQGFRPLAAFRAVTPVGRRRRLRPTKESSLVWQLEVLLDKDNPLGRCPAVRRRWLPDIPVISAMMAHLPIALSEFDTIRVMQHAVLRRHKISQLYAARRDAAVAAEQAGRDPAAVLNHRPGSRTTPVYTGTTTPTALLRAMLQSN